MEKTLEKTKIEIGLIQQNMKPEDVTAVIEAAERFVPDYVYKVAREERRNPFILQLLQKAISLRISQEEDRKLKLKEFAAQINAVS